MGGCPAPRHGHRVREHGVPLEHPAGAELGDDATVDEEVIGPRAHDGGVRVAVAEVRGLPVARDEDVARLVDLDGGEVVPSPAAEVRRQLEDGIDDQRSLLVVGVHRERDTLAHDDSSRGDANPLVSFALVDVRRAVHEALARHLDDDVTLVAERDAIGALHLDRHGARGHTRRQHEVVLEQAVVRAIDDVDAGQHLAGAHARIVRCARLRRRRRAGGRQVVRLGQQRALWQESLGAAARDAQRKRLRGRARRRRAPPDVQVSFRGEAGDVAPGSSEIRVALRRLAEVGSKNSGSDSDSGCAGEAPCRADDAASGEVSVSTSSPATRLGGGRSAQSVKSAAALPTSVSPYVIAPRQCPLRAATAAV